METERSFFGRTAVLKKRKTDRTAGLSVRQPGTAPAVFPDEVFFGTSDFCRSQKKNKNPIPEADSDMG